MKILIVAYEFPPSPSPQSLRWMYLSRELARIGHEVHVLAPEIPPPHGALHVPAEVTVHRTSAGPVRGLVALLAKRKAAKLASLARDTAPAAAGANPGPGLNWKGRLMERVQRVAGHVLFPDIRGEWKWPARRRLRVLLSRIAPDIVISSHEPAVTLELGLTASNAGYRWVADLGDPVLAPYTPARWRRRSWKLEAQACQSAEQLIVTNHSARRLLVSRHGLDESRVHVLTQGFEHRSTALSQSRRHGGIELLYAGSFYSFRRPDNLLAAVVATPRARLSIASAQVPELVRDYAERFPESISLLGFVPHAQVLRLQQESDVLVNLGNQDPSQLPGKFFEYLGARRPILHVSQSVEDDEAAAILVRTGCGWVVEDRQDAIARVLSQAASGAYAHTITDESVMEYSWTRIAGRLERVLFPPPAFPARGVSDTWTD